MTLLLAKFLPSNRGKYTPPVPPVPPTYADLRLANRGSEAATVTYVYEGDSYTQSLNPAKVFVLPHKLIMGKKVSEVYTSVTAYFPTAGRTVTYDVEQTVDDTTEVFEFTDATAPLGESIITIYNPDPAIGYNLVYDHNGNITTIAMDPYGEYDLPEPVTNGNAINSVYDSVTAELDDVTVFTADLTVTVNDDMTITIVATPPTPPEEVTVTFQAYLGTPAPASQTLEVGDLVTEPTAPEVDQADIPQGYTGDGSSNGWYNGTTAWNFQTFAVLENTTLKTYYNVTRDVSYLDEENGNTFDNGEAYYPFSATAPVTQDYLVPAGMGEPTDPQGLNREFLGWAYKVGGVETQISFNTVFPDAGNMMTAAIPTTVTEVYALWGEPQADNFELDLGSSNLRMAPYVWQTADDSSSGSVNCYPWIADGTYGTTFGEMSDAIVNETIGTCTITQNAGVENSYEFDTFTADGSTISMSNAMEETSMEMDETYGVDFDKIFLYDFVGVSFNTAADPSSSANATIVLDQLASGTDASYLINTMQNTQNVFLAQYDNPNCAYICNFEKTVDPGVDATLTFSIGTQEDADYQQLDLVFSWDADESDWVFDNLNKTGFDNVITE